MQQLSKPEALALLEHHKRALLRHPDECVMCALAERRDPELVIAESQAGSVVLDRFGNRAGHLLVIAARHVERATQLEFAAYSQLQRLVYDACQALERALDPKRVYVAAFGSDAAVPMTFVHYHVHVVPVFDDGEASRPARVFSWTEGVVTYEPPAARELVASLRGAWPG